jgi:hypothetical protein
METQTTLRSNLQYDISSQYQANSSYSRNPAKVVIELDLTGSFPVPISPAVSASFCIFCMNQKACHVPALHIFWMDLHKE